MNKLMKVAFVGLMPLSILAAGATSTMSQEVFVDAPYDFYDDTRDVVVDDGIEFEGAILASESGMQRCAETFRSFEPATGTYTGYDGLIRRCPYI
jgi:hypothetical protein